MSSKGPTGNSLSLERERENAKNQPEVFLHKVFVETPSQVMDVRAKKGQGCPRKKKKKVSCASSEGVKVLELERPPGYPPGRPRDIPPKKLHV